MFYAFPLIFCSHSIDHRDHAVWINESPKHSNWNCDFFFHPPLVSSVNNQAHYQVIVFACDFHPQLVSHVNNQAIIFSFPRVCACVRVRVCSRVLACAVMCAASFILHTKELPMRKVRGDYIFSTVCMCMHACACDVCAFVILCVWCSWALFVRVYVCLSLHVPVFESCNKNMFLLRALVCAYFAANYL